MLTDMRFFLVLCLFLGSLSAVAEEVSFQQEVRPILSNHCFACHGFDENERKAGLRLDTREGAFADLGGYHAIVPGDPEASEAWLRIISDDPDEVMPPPKHHGKLTGEEKDIIRRWIEGGAEFQRHWSFLPPVKPEVPPRVGPGSEIDAFVQEKLSEEGLSPAEEAPRATLIRRVTLDLTGLPPTPSEVDRFLRDDSEKAYERLVDELLSRDTYGEHMARYWLDLARYGDTHGLHLDNERSMWPYRDWVIRAFNQNISFADFTRWQLAGDLVPEPSRDQLIASGFNRCNVTTSEGGSIKEEWIYRYAVDRTATAVEVWMGLTASCAVCHDHKFDPLSMKDFYSMYAFFHSAADPAMDGNKIDTPPILKLTSAEDEERLAKLGAQIAEVDARIDRVIAETEYVDPATLENPPPRKTVEKAWFDEAFPSGAKPRTNGHPLRYVTAEDGRVFRGDRALQRTASAEVAQDFFSGGAKFTVPRNANIFVHCWLDPENPPEAIMLQFHDGGWKHRAVWGDPEKIPFGKPGTTQKVHLGDLPRAGEWVRLEFPARQLGLKQDQTVDGFAFTQFGGTVTWDYLGVATTTNPATDPDWSWQVWKNQPEGERRRDLPDALGRGLQGRKPETWSKKEYREVFDHWLRTRFQGVREKLEPLENEKAPLLAEKSKIEEEVPITMIMADLPEARESFVMERGQYDNPGERVSRDVPSFLPPLPAKPDDRDYNRLDFAEWLVDGGHPLTARVAVNRFWQQFFGTGLVETSADFGSQGTPPSHPELLDWLAVQFVEDGWDIKHLVRRIVTSHAYRQSTRVTPELLDQDPNNRLISRGPRFRLDAEVIRDQALYISGLLVDRIGGKGINPYQPPNIWEPVGFGNSNTRYYKQGTGDDLYRRSIYTFIKRTAPPPFMSTFDAPNREQSCSVRGVSNTPLQALQLMNDIQHVEAARHLAQRAWHEAGPSDDDRIRWTWQMVTARLPEPEELRIAANALAQHRNRYASDDEAARALISYGESPVDKSIPPVELAAHTLLANLILNLDETVNKN